ncbi:MAG: radical SAM family heme chaperone HemW [Tepidisphaeraceae bacterium]
MRLETFTADSIDLRAADIPAGAVDGLYVHIPFCFHKCHYCDFYSITRQSPERMTRFVDLLLAEAELWQVHAPRPTTVFFGGGTPSLLPLEPMRRLIDGLRDRFDLTAVNEWTIEINPATADFDYLCMLRQSGVDRLSFGAQSFDPEELRTLERHHDPQDVYHSIDLARRAGFERLNIDLIYAIPGQTLDSWRRSLEAALSLGLSHYSCYGLTYEPNTVIAVKKRLGQLIAQPDDTELQMYQAARELLGAAGRPWYEISNYAAPGQECRHNLMYWSGQNYVGLGPSAASHVAGHRFKNRPHLGEWEHGVPSGSLPIVEHEQLSDPQRVAERVMLSLRLRTGVRWDDFDIDLRETYAGPLDQLQRVGLIAIDADGFRLTERGLNVADGIAGEFAA